MSWRRTQRMDRIKVDSFANAPRVKHAACVRVVIAGCFGIVAACAQAAAPTPARPTPLTFAIASDVVLPGLNLPLLHLDDIAGIAAVAEACAVPFDVVHWQAQ